MGRPGEGLEGEPMKKEWMDHIIMLVNDSCYILGRIIGMTFGRAMKGLLDEFDHITNEKRET
jgi:hypothetical protein